LFSALDLLGPVFFFFSKFGGRERIKGKDRFNDSDLSIEKHEGKTCMPFIPHYRRKNARTKDTFIANFYPIYHSKIFILLKKCNYLF